MTKSAIRIDHTFRARLDPLTRQSRRFWGAIEPLLAGRTRSVFQHVENISNKTGLMVGDSRFLSWEDELANQWNDSLKGKPQAFGALWAISQAIAQAAVERDASVVFLDMGPNLAAVNRAALIAAEHVVFPLAPDLYALYGLRSLGPTLRRWRDEWSERRQQSPLRNLSTLAAAMRPLGYVVLENAARLDRPFSTYQRLMMRIPNVYIESVLNETARTTIAVANDPNCLGAMKPYRSLMELAREARKPMFFLKPSDGALGGHAKAVQECFKDFRALALTIADRCGVPLS